MARKAVDLRNDVVCHNCREPMKYDPVTSIRAIEPGQPGVYYVVCSVKCRRAVQGGVG